MLSTLLKDFLPETIGHIALYGTVALTGIGLGTADDVCLGNGSAPIVRGSYYHAGWHTIYFDQKTQVLFDSIKSTVPIASPKGKFIFFGFMCAFYPDGY
jgi:hypothetical protein